MAQIFYWLTKCYVAEDDYGRNDAIEEGVRQIVK
jgi:hypothetical protein